MWNHFSSRTFPSLSANQKKLINRHVLHVVGSYDEFKQVVINTIDTDVLVLLISYFGRLDIEIYAHLTAGKKYYDVREIAKSLGKEVCLALPFFYFLTDCDTISSYTEKESAKPGIHGLVLRINMNLPKFLENWGTSQAK